MALEPQENLPATGIAVNIEMPAPTAWPIILAFGTAMLFAGLLTSASLSGMGAILALTGCVGWFREVLPHEQHVLVQAMDEEIRITTSRREVARVPIAPDARRAKIPVEIYPVGAGIKGGLAGSVAMAALASLYGLVSHGSIWYPINLLASVVYAQPFQLSMQHLTSFHPALLLIAAVFHLMTSVLVGLMYGALLPMFPRRPILLGGLVAPIMWSGLLHTSLGIINPLLNQRIDWTWFVASQIAFGIVAGLVVERQERVRTRQFMPFEMRAGIDAPGIMEEKEGGPRNNEPL